MAFDAYLDLKYDKSYFTNKTYDDAFTITALVDNCQIILYSDSTPRSFSISYDNGMTWTDITISTTTSLDPIDEGETIKIVGHNLSQVYPVRIFSEEDNYFDVSGNILTLLDGDTYKSMTSMTSVAFAYLFSYDGTYRSYVRDASRLILPSFTSGSCYENMFAGCTSLIAAPKLPATTLASRCYQLMFSQCTSLTDAPELPATTLANQCYHYMFSGCTSLINVPESLPATTLVQECYRQMFSGCTSLTTAPVLPAATLATSCYRDMFAGCTSLTTAPVLPAANLSSNCYRGMFDGCTSLNYIKILATSAPFGLSDSLYNWVRNVAPTGTFVKDTNMTYDIDSNSGVPIGWTVYDEGQYIPRTYIVTVSADPNGGGAVSGGGDYLEGTNVIVIANPTEGYKLIGWYYGSTLVSDSTTYAFTIDSNVNLTARFEEIEYYDVTLAQDPSVGATLTGAGTYESGTRVTVIASVVNGYNFLGWSFNGSIISTSMSYTFTLGSDITLTAMYEEYRDYEHMYLTVKSLESNTTLKVTLFSDWHMATYASVEYRINGESWQQHVFKNGEDVRHDLYLSFGNNDEIQFRNYIAPVDLETSGREFNMNITTNNSKLVNVYGNVMSLLHDHIDFEHSTNNYFVGTNLSTLGGQYELANLFRGCAVVNASNLLLPATTLTGYGNYYAMFQDCTSLITAPTFPATTLVEFCYASMFKGCISLSATPTLPATTLAEKCYEAMFDGCTSLTTTTELPATTLAYGCYYCMFQNCSALSAAPALPATTLKIRCYRAMFAGCYSLHTAPELPATTLREECYGNMFQLCTSLNYVKCLATSISNESTTNWLYLVASNGTFVKDPNMTWGEGNNGIPTGWTVVDAT